MKKFRSILCTLLAIIMCICLSSCSGSINEKTATTTTIINTKIASETAVESTTKIEEKSTTEATTKKAEDTTTSATKKARESTTKKQESKDDSTTTSTTKKAENTCRITIECKQILSHFDDLEAGHDRYVPSDGYILKGYSQKVENNDTAYDILKRACDDNNIKITATHTGYGIYIVGINNLDEKDCGRYSGWMYKVNGEEPSKACDKFNVNVDDEIVFYYICEYN